jgi:hypothetical protein
LQNCAYAAEVKNANIKSGAKKLFFILISPKLETLTLYGFQLTRDAFKGTFSCIISYTIYIFFSLCVKILLLYVIFLSFLRDYYVISRFFKKKGHLTSAVFKPSFKCSTGKPKTGS